MSFSPTNNMKQEALSKHTANRARHRTFILKRNRKKFNFRYTTESLKDKSWENKQDFRFILQPEMLSSLSMFFSNPKPKKKAAKQQKT